MAESRTDTTKVGPELVLGLVGPTGIDLDKVQNALTECLADVGYTSDVVRLTDWLVERLRASGGKISEALDEKIDALQDTGNQLRARLKRGDAMALVGVELIARMRRNRTGSGKQFAPRHAWIVRQLKHPDEVRLLREVYGPAFYLIGLYEEEAFRISTLMTGIARSRVELSQQEKFGEAARRLIKRDMAEEDTFGQNVRDTFPLADFFVHTQDQNSLRYELHRFVELIFGNDLRTARLEEYLMFQSRAVALRSADLSRQVGAVIASSDGSVISVGMNEVPRVGGRWFIDGDSPDMRDSKFDFDPSTMLKHEALAEILERLRAAGMLSATRDGADKRALLAEVAPIMRGTRFMGIGEFGRTVHAEMAALMDAAKRGVGVEGQILFTTTFPCQNCAKHIIAAGIQIVIYMEPYPKSLTSVLYEGQFQDGPMRNLDFEPPDDKVYFGTYLGVAPRMYTQLFAMGVRRDRDGNTVKWSQQPKQPRLLREQSDPTILERESAAVVFLDEFQRRAAGAS